MSAGEAGTAVHPVHDVLAVIAAPPRSGVVADLGCGPGRTLAALEHHWPSVRLIGIDIAAGSLATVRELGIGAELVQADLRAALPLGDASTDVVVCHNVIELLPDPSILFTEAHRVLRPGGRAVWSHTDFASLIIHGAGVDLTARVHYAYAHIPQRWMAHIDPYAGRRLPGLARCAGFAVGAFDAHTVAVDTLTGQARRRIDEITEVVSRHARHQMTDVTEADVATWRAQLEQAAVDGLFSFAETVFITNSSKPAA